MRADFLIAGQGLAGSLLAWELLQRGQRVVVADPGGDNASRVAAGLINPITGMRLVKTPDVEILWPAAIAYYRQLQSYFGQDFFIAKPLLRILANRRQWEYARQRGGDVQYHPFIERIEAPEQNSPHGSLWLRNSGYLRIAALLDCVRGELVAKDSFRNAELRHTELQIGEHSVQWHDIEVSRVVFCEGHGCRQNPWFAWLPLQPVQGDILTLRTASILPDYIVNYGQWMLPLDQQTLRVGATFERGRLDKLPSAAAKHELLRNLLVNCPRTAVAEVLDHKAGIRPATLDKQPFIGAHPRLPRLTIFNGFGAKGALAIPYYASRCADFLLHGLPLPANADIQRYAAAYFPG